MILKRIIIRQFSMLLIGVFFFVSVKGQDSLKIKEQYDSLVQVIQLPQNIYLSMPEKPVAGTFKNRKIHKFKLRKRGFRCYPNDHDNLLFQPHTAESFGSTEFPSKSRYNLAAYYIVKLTPKKFTTIDSSERYTKEERRKLKIKDSVVIVPGSWAKRIDLKDIQKIWFQCSAIINMEGEPIRKQNLVEPIFLETLNGNFKISVKNVFQWNLGGSSDGFDTPFSGFVLRGCKGDDPIFRTFLQKLQTRIISKLQAYPYSASLYRDITVPDNELWLIRKGVASNLLQALYIENSKYFITWNFVEDGLGKIIGLKFFLRQELLIETGKGNGYEEPKESQKEKYKQQLNIMVNECVHDVCLEFKLQYDLINFCKCN